MSLYELSEDCDYNLIKIKLTKSGMPIVIGILGRILSEEIELKDDLMENATTMERQSELVKSQVQYQQDKSRSRQSEEISQNILSSTVLQKRRVNRNKG